MDRTPLKRHCQPKFDPKEWDLYAILDESFLKGRKADRLAEQICRGGASVIQYRNKRGSSAIIRKRIKEIGDVARNYGIPFILNDDAVTALEAGADGVHIGSDDGSPEQVRSVAGDHFLIGYSVRNPGELDNAAQADYIGAGALFPTETHSKYPVLGLEGTAAIRRQTALPIIGIGGITLNRIDPVIHAGCDGIAVISALLDARNVELRTAMLVREIRKAKEKR